MVSHPAVVADGDIELSLGSGHYSFQQEGYQQIGHQGQTGLGSEGYLVEGVVFQVSALSAHGSSPTFDVTRGCKDPEIGSLQLGYRKLGGKVADALKTGREGGAKNTPIRT